MKYGRIYNEDCLDTMSRMESGCVDLVVTSPPYDNLRTYKGFSFDYKSTLTELYKVMKDGGVVVWVVGDASKDGNESGNSFRQALFAQEAGFSLADTMIYQKCGMSKPGSPHLYYQTFEYMFVLCKGSKPRVFNPICDVLTQYKSLAHGYHTMRKKDGSKERKKNRKNRMAKRGNVWQYSSNLCDNPMDHPAVFPEPLAADHIRSWSDVGDLVYDPFSGSGTTCRMAKRLGREYIGSEVCTEWCEQSNKLIEQELYLFGATA